MLDFLRSFPNKLRHNFWLKLVSLALAFVVWVIVVAYYNPETTNTIEGVPVTVNYEQSVLKEQGLILVTVPDETIDVKIEGRREKLALIGKDKVTAVISIASVTKPGEYDLPINVAVDGQTVTTVSQSKQTMRLKFEKAISSQFTVDVITKGEVAKDYVLEKVATPTVVTVSGPKSVVEKITTIQAVVSKEQFTESGVYDATIMYLDKNGEKLEDTFLTTDTVKVNISVLAEKVVPLQVELINSAGGNDGMYLQPVIEPETITIAGSAEALEAINNISLGKVDVAEIDAGAVKELPLILPNGIKNVSAVEKAKVTFDFDGAVTKQFKISTDLIQFENLVAGTKVSVPDGEITVKVRGDASDMNKLKASDISLRIDCKNQSMPKGSNRMAVYCAFPDPYKVGAIGKYELTVKIS